MDKSIYKRVASLTLADKARDPTLEIGFIR